MSMDYSDHPLHAVPSSSYLAQNDSEFLEVAAQVIAGSGAVVDPTAYSAAPVTSSANGWFNTSPHTVPPATGTMLGVSMHSTSFSSSLTELPSSPVTGTPESYLFHCLPSG